MVIVVPCVECRVLPSLSHDRVGTGLPVALQVRVRFEPWSLDIVAGSGVTCTGTGIKFIRMLVNYYSFPINLIALLSACPN